MKSTENSVSAQWILAIIITNSNPSHDLMKDMPTTPWGLIHMDDVGNMP